nr:hypothetical protein BaRGS_034933 [Batillaria attramentaria]
MLVNVVGNTIVLRTILRHDSLRTPANSLICSLAASDLLFGLLYPIYNVSHIDLPVIENSLGEWSVCRIIMTEVLALELCSSYGLVAIALSRHFIVAHPLRYRQYLNTRSCSVVIVTLWVVAHIICVIVYAKESPPQGYCNICRFEMMYPLTHLTILTAMQFLLPFIIMVVSNVQVGSTSVGHQAQCRWKCGLHLRQKSVVVVTLLVGCFALAWAPQLLYLFLVIVGKLEETQFEYLG